MKKSDIKVGTEYAYVTYGGPDAHRETPSRAIRVRVTGEAHNSATRSWDRANYQWPVEFLNNDGEATSTGFVPSRELREPWADFAAFKVEDDERRLRLATARQTAHRARARKAAKLVKLLSAAGVPVPQYPASVDERQAAVYATYGFNTYEDGHEGSILRTCRFAEPLSDQIIAYIQTDTKIKVDVDTLMSLAAGAAPREPVVFTDAAGRRNVVGR